MTARPTRNRTRTLPTMPRHRMADRLTPRERDVLLLRAQGLSSQATADVLFISKRTVDFHLANLYTKLQCDSTIEALWAAGLVVWSADAALPGFRKQRCDRGQASESVGASS